MGDIASSEIPNTPFTPISLPKYNNEDETRPTSCLHRTYCGRTYSTARLLSCTFFQLAAIGLVAAGILTFLKVIPLSSTMGGAFFGMAAMTHLTAWVLCCQRPKFQLLQ